MSSAATPTTRLLPGARMEERRQASEPGTSDRPPASSAASRTNCRRLFMAGSPLDRFQKQVLEIVAEVGVRRERLHAGLDDGAVGIEDEGDEGVGPEPAVAPTHDEGLAAPVFHVA